MILKSLFGELGTIGAPATVINAVVDALSHLGVTHVNMPASPSRIWGIIDNGRVGNGMSRVSSRT